MDKLCYIILFWRLVPFRLLSVFGFISVSIFIFLFVFQFIFAFIVLSVSISIFLFAIRVIFVFIIISFFQLLSVSRSISASKFPSASRLISISLPISPSQFVNYSLKPSYCFLVQLSNSLTLLESTPQPNHSRWTNYYNYHSNFYPTCSTISRILQHIHPHYFFTPSFIIYVIWFRVVRFFSLFDLVIISRTATIIDRINITHFRLFSSIIVFLSVLVLILRFFVRGFVFIFGWDWAHHTNLHICCYLWYPDSLSLSSRLFRQVRWELIFDDYFFVKKP